jgi:hypothetical protein
MTRDAVDDALDTGLIDNVLDIIGEVATELDTIMDDVRELDPERDLAEQIGDLVQRRVADALYDRLGSELAIRVAFDVTVFGHRHRISLGRIEVPLELIVDTINQTFRELAAFEAAIRAAARTLASAFSLEQALHKAEADRAGAQEKLGRLERQRNALITAPGAVRILSPMAGGVNLGTSRITIEIQGILRDAAIDDDAPASVHIFLNDRELALSSFTITELGARPTAAIAGSMAIHDARQHFDPLAALDLKPHPASRRHGQIGGSAAPRSGVRPLGSLTLKGPALKAARLAFTHASVVAQGLDLAPRSVGPPASGRTAREAASPLRAPLPARAERRFGAKLTVSQIGKLIDPSVPGLILTRNLQGGELELGLNTLVVSVIPAQGPRVEASCAFIVDERPQRPPKLRPGSVRLPVTPPAQPNTTRPSQVAGKALLRPRAEREKTIAAQRALILDRGRSKKAALRKAMMPIATHKPLLPRGATPER